MGKAAANSTLLKSKKWREEEEKEKRREENRTRTKRDTLENRNTPLQELKEVSLPAVLKPALVFGSPELDSATC